MNTDDRLKVLQAIHGGQGARSGRRSKPLQVRRDYTIEILAGLLLAALPVLFFLAFTGIIKPAGL